MSRHHQSCDCPVCLRYYHQRDLWIGSIFTVLAAVALLHTGAWLIQLLSSTR